MMEKFDDIFRKNVEKAFDDYNVDHLADEAWNSFMLKRSSLQRPVAWASTFAKVASVLLIIGFGAMISYMVYLKQTEHIITTEEIASEKNTLSDDDIIISENQTILKEHGSSDNENFIPQGSIQTIKHEKSADKNLTSVMISSADVSFTENNSEEEKLEKAERKAEDEFKQNDFLSEINEFEDIKPEFNLRKDQEYLNIKKLSELDKLLALNISPELKNPEDKIPDEYPGYKYMPDRKKSESREHHRETMFMAGLSGSFAQSGKISSPVSGLSLGVYVNQDLTKYISFRPGLAFARQSLEVGNTNPPQGYNYSMSLADGTVSVPHSYNGQLSMMAMELPLNFVFRIAELKKGSEFFISAGSSSIIYLSQNLMADFVNELTRSGIDMNTGSYETESRLSTLEVRSNYGSFSRADLFGLINFSAGYTLTYGKVASILIEPFFQLPVNDLTNLNLRIKYGGMSVKMGFGKN